MPINTVGIALVSACAPTALLNITPGEIRGQVIATYFLVISVTGLLLGPTTIGLLSDLVFGEQNIRHAAALVPMLYGLPVLFTLAATRKRYRALMAARSQT